MYMLSIVCVDEYILECVLIYFNSFLLENLHVLTSISNRVSLCVTSDGKTHQRIRFPPDVKQVKLMVYLTQLTHNYFQASTYDSERVSNTPYTFREEEDVDDSISRESSQYTL